MKCNECGGDYLKKHGRLKLTDKWIGDYEVLGVTYLECELCQDRLFPP